MSRGRTAVVVVLLVLAGGIVLAAAGVMPLPGQRQTIPVVESGSPEARAAGEVTMPPPSTDDPFAPPIPVVESGSPEARDLVGEVVTPPPPTDDPFAPAIPVIESGSPEARDLVGEEITRLPEPPATAESGESDEAARARREAAFTANSRFPPNPESERGVYRFDLRLFQLVDSSRGLDRITYFANTADGSLLFPDWALSGLLPAGTFGDADLHFVLRQADGDVIACGKHPDVGLACLLLGENLGPGFAWLRDMSLHREFLASIPRTPQRLGEGPGGNVQGLRGRGADIVLQMWVDRNASRIATQMPFVGAGVGVMKDFRVRANRIVRRTRWEGGDLDGGDLVIDLLQIEPALMERDTTPYRFVTAFTAEGIAEAIAIGEQAPDLMAQAMEIEQALAACPKGRAGSDCRRVNRERMKALNEGLRDQALDYGRRHGLPVDE